MGLDMVGWTIPAEYATSDVDVDRGEDAPERTEIAYWRKHPDLHEWMERLYLKKGGTDPEFNCNNVRLTLEDLDRLERDMAHGLPKSGGGLFWGESAWSDEHETETREFIAKAREAIAEGLAVFYDSWW